MLVPNFLHHFDPPTNVKFAETVQRDELGAALAIVEFVPNDDRISPPMAAASVSRCWVELTRRRLHVSRV